MIIGRRRSQSNGDGAFGVFCRIGDELVDDKPQRDAECCRYLDIHTLHRDGAIRSVLEEQTRKVLAQVMDILLELHSPLMIEHMQLPVHASQTQRLDQPQYSTAWPLRACLPPGSVATAGSRSVASC